MEKNLGRWNKKTGNDYNVTTVPIFAAPILGIESDGGEKTEKLVTLNGTFSDFSDWGTCTPGMADPSLGIGSRTRCRSCEPVLRCDGTTAETETCNPEPTKDRSGTPAFACKYSEVRLRGQTK